MYRRCTRSADATGGPPAAHPAPHRARTRRASRGTTDPPGLRRGGQGRSDRPDPRRDGAADGRVAIESNFLSYDAVAKFRTRLPAPNSSMPPDHARRHRDQVPGRDRPAPRVRADRRIGVAAAVEHAGRGPSWRGRRALRCHGAQRRRVHQSHDGSKRSAAYGNYPFLTARKLEDRPRSDRHRLHVSAATSPRRSPGSWDGQCRSRWSSLTSARMLEAGIASRRRAGRHRPPWQAALDVGDRAGIQDRAYLLFVGHWHRAHAAESPFISSTATTVLDGGLGFRARAGRLGAGQPPQPA